MNEKPRKTMAINHEAVAAEVRQTIAAALARVPKPLEGRPNNDTFVRAHRTIPREFVEALAGGGLRDVEGTFDRNAAMDVLRFLDAFRPLRDYLQEMADALTYTMEKAYADVAADGLIAYHLTKRAARRPGRHDRGLTLHVLKKHLGRSRGKKKRGPDTEAPGPDPTST